MKEKHILFVDNTILNDINNLQETSDTRQPISDPIPITTFDDTTIIKISVTINNIVLSTNLSIGTIKDMLIIDSTLNLENMLGKLVLEHINALTKRH